jgi:hypothetical protein
MNSIGSNSPFSDIPTKAIFPAGAVAIAAYELFHHFGQQSAGRIAAFSVIALVGVIAKSRPLWSETWFWIFVSVVVLLHVAIIVSLKWPDPHYPALYLAPFAFIDYFAMIKLIELIYRQLDRTD